MELLKPMKLHLCKVAVSLLHLWNFAERLVIRLFLRSYVEGKVKDFYGLDGPNKGLVRVNDPEFYIRAANKGLLGFCESYMKGWISITQIDKVVENVMKSGKLKRDPGFRYKAFLDWLEFDVFEVRNNNEYYDQATEVFEAMLGPGMNYSCGLWLHPDDTLDSAQRNKMELIAKKLKLKPGMRVLDIGCGYGALAKYLAEEHGVEVVGTTDSIEGVKYAKRFCAGVKGVEFRLSDCRDIIEREEKFDRIVVVEVLVHVGKENYKAFFSNVHKCLKDDGLFLLHAIGNNDPLMPAVNSLSNTYQSDARLPFIGDVVTSSAEMFIVEDWGNIGAHYDKTQLAWNENFKKHWNKFVASRGEEFCRMWSFTLQTNAAVARTRNIQIWHIVFSKNGVPGGYSY